MRKGFVLGMLALLFAGISYIFWQEELRYSLPTPIPEDYKEVAIGSCIELPLPKEDWNPRKAQFLHFFNPDCPCSRFNATHFKYLLRSFGEELDFRIIIPEGASEERTRKLLSKNIPVHQDTEGKWSLLTGVYASPQAVIIDSNQALYYRGNYNKARFCTFPGSNYAEISINLLLRGNEAPVWDFYASRAYGCQLPEVEDPLSSLFFWSNNEHTIPSLWNVNNSH